MIDLHKYPSNWDLVIVATIIRHNVYIDVDRLLLQQMATNELIKKGRINPGLMDHWGTDTETDSLVCEPYQNLEADAKWFAEFFGLTLITGEPPSWNKSCNRYRFQMPSDTVIMEMDTGAIGVIKNLIEAVRFEFDLASSLKKQLDDLSEDTNERTLTNAT